MQNHSNKRIAVIGAGIAGLTISFLLKEKGYEVSLFEQAEKCKPVGAGLILQPSGQLILNQLGMLEQIERTSFKLDGIEAKLKSGKKLVSIKYDKASPNLYGLGVRRSIVFDVLYQRCISSGVKIFENSKIEKIENSSKVIISSKQVDMEFDLLIAADGSRSTIRELLFNPVKKIEYNYAALWTLAKHSKLPNFLLQIVDGTKRLSGILPVDNNTCSFFWGIHKDEKEKIWSKGLAGWKEDVLKFSPELAEPLDSISSLEQLTYSTYRSCLLKTYHKNRVVFIGDAAHSSSPHLGQGVNLALQDALALAESFNPNDNHLTIFNNYFNNRKKVNSYYSQITAILTPFFQSDHNYLSYARNIVLPIMPKLPFIGVEMAKSMAGIKQNWLK